MNIKQLMLIMASFSLMPLGAAEQMPEASSSTETNTPQPAMGNASLEYGTCTLEDKTTSGCCYPQPNTETFAQIQPLKNNATIQAVTLLKDLPETQVDHAKQVMICIRLYVMD